MPLYLEYNYGFERRWDPNGHPLISSMIQGSKQAFEKNLKEISTYSSMMKAFNKPGGLPMDFDNGFMPVIDGLSVSWAARRASNVYMEIGSGYSTVYARAGIADSGLKAKVISIDPSPRAEIDSLCDEVIRAPLEQVSLNAFDQLAPGDAIFLDGSHRSFTNSDVTVFFLDILPRLPSGVLVGIHDICLPFDYIDAWRDRGYNEQYMLAAVMLANPHYFDLQLCNFWITQQGMQRELQDIWLVAGAKAKSRAASAFWAVKN
jgi:hypothetical protein